MEKTRLVIVGTGWRAQFYVRVAKALPELFDLVGIGYYAESEREYAGKWGAPLYRDYMEMIRKEKPDMAAICVNRASGANLKTVSEIAGAGVTVLMETPPADTLPDMIHFYEVCKGLPIQVSEQYQFQPECAARIEIAKSGILGTVYQSRLNLPNGYHSASVHRKILGVGMALPTVRAFRYQHERLICGDRSGDPKENKLVPVTQMIYQLDFGDKQALNDLEGDQVRCWFRRNQAQVRGTHGEIIDNDIYYMKDYLTPCHFTMDRLQAGTGPNLEGGFLRGIRGPEGLIYENPFKPARLFDDEIAVATCMLRTAEFAKTGNPFYNIEEALQDSYLGMLTEQAANEGRVIQAEHQVWMGE